MEKICMYTLLIGNYTPFALYSSGQQNSASQRATVYSTLCKLKWPGYSVAFCHCWRFVIWIWREQPMIFIEYWIVIHIAKDTITMTGLEFTTILSTTHHMRLPLSIVLELSVLSIVNSPGLATLLPVWPLVTSFMSLNLSFLNVKKE